MAVKKEERKSKEMCEVCTAHRCKQLQMFFRHPDSVVDRIDNPNDKIRIVTGVENARLWIEFE